MSINTSANALTNSVNAIRSKAIMTMQDYGVFPGVFDRQSVQEGNRSFTEPKIGTVTAYDLTEGIDMAQGQILGDTLMTVTPAEIGVQLILTKIAMRSKSESFERVAHDAMTDALKKAQDTDGTEQMDNFSVSLGGSSSYSLTRGYLGAARARIRGGSEPFKNDPLVCVVHDYTFNDLIDAAADGLYVATPANAYYPQGQAGVPEEAWHKYAVGRVADMDILTDANFAIASNAAKGGVFTKRSVVYAEMWGIDIELEKDASLRGSELNGTMCYAYGERNDGAGVELFLSATAPTA